MHTLSTENLVKIYMQAGVTTEILKGVTYNFTAACSYAISGVSGTGKSTLLHLLAGIDQPTSGCVAYDDVNLCDMARDDKVHFLQQAIGLVFQDSHLIKELTVIENVMLKALIAGTAVAGTAHQESFKKAMHMLEQVDLADKANHHPLSLSGGQQQRVAVLRALFNQPQFLLADEPTGNLDAENACVVLELLMKGVTEGMGLIICSHDPMVARAMHKRLVLERGILVEYT